MPPPTDPNSGAEVAATGQSCGVYYQYFNHGAIGDKEIDYKNKDFYLHKDNCYLLKNVTLRVIGISEQNEIKLNDKGTQVLDDHSDTGMLMEIYNYKYIKEHIEKSNVNLTIRCVEKNNEQKIITCVPDTYGDREKLIACYSDRIKAIKELEKSIFKRNDVIGNDDIFNEVVGAGMFEEWENKDDNDKIEKLQREALNILNTNQTIMDLPISPEGAQLVKAVDVFLHSTKENSNEGEALPLFTSFLGNQFEDIKKIKDGLESNKIFFKEIDKEYKQKIETYLIEYKQKIKTYLTEYKQKKETYLTEYKKNTGSEVTTDKCKEKAEKAATNEYWKNINKATDEYWKNINKATDECKEKAKKAATNEYWKAIDKCKEKAEKAATNEYWKNINKATDECKEEAKKAAAKEYRKNINKAIDKCKKKAKNLYSERITASEILFSNSFYGEDIYKCLVYIIENAFNFIIKEKLKDITCRKTYTEKLKELNLIVQGYQAKNQQIQEIIDLNLNVPEQIRYLDSLFKSEVINYYLKDIENYFDFLYLRENLSDKYYYFDGHGTHSSCVIGKPFDSEKIPEFQNKYSMKDARLYSYNKADLNLLKEMVYAKNTKLNPIVFLQCNLGSGNDSFAENFSKVITPLTIYAANTIDYVGANSIGPEAAVNNNYPITYIANAIQELQELQEPLKPKELKKLEGIEGIEELKGLENDVLLKIGCGHFRIFNYARKIMAINYDKNELKGTFIKLPTLKAYEEELPTLKAYEEELPTLKAYEEELPTLKAYEEELPTVKLPIFTAYEEVPWRSKKKKILGSAKLYKIIKFYKKPKTGKPASSHGTIYMDLDK